MTHTPLTPRSTAPPVLSGISGAAASSSRSLRSRRPPLRTRARRRRRTRDRRGPSSAPSSGLQRDVAGEAVGDDDVGAAAQTGRGPSTLPMKPFTSASSARGPLAEARRPCPASSPFESSATVGSSIAEPHPRVLAAEARPLDEPRGLRIDGRAGVEEDAPAVDARWIGHRGSGAELRSRGAAHRGCGPCASSAAAIVAPVLPAPTIAWALSVADRLGAAHERRVLLRADRGGGLVVHRDDLVRREHARRPPAGRRRATAR